MAPSKELKKLWPPPTTLLKNLPLKTNKTFYLPFISNSRISSVSFKIMTSWPPCRSFTVHGPVLPSCVWPTLGNPDLKYHLNFQQHFFKKKV